MKKKIQLLCGLGILAVIYMGIIWREDSPVCLQFDENGLYVKVPVSGEDEILWSWFDEESDVWYFFLPSFLRNTEIKDERSEGREDNIEFMYSSNIPAVFIETESGGLEYLHADKENAEEGTIKVITSDGNVEYHGKLESISGRGNSTWQRYEKKPYTITLQNAYPLCGMDSGEKWCLLAGWRESTKLTSKLVLDMARAIGLEYSPMAVWVDLYLNGQYAGNYLLCESVSVGEGRVEISDGGDITGGYLIEKDLTAYYEEEEAGFTIESGKTFTIAVPKHASRQQVSYIQEYFQRIDDMIKAGSEESWNYIDLDSFAKRFLIDEISLNYDADITSMYFYKKANDDLIYAGPVWDYDSALGASTEWTGGCWVDYEWSTLYQNKVKHEEEVLDWYNYLYENEVFYNKICQEYEAFLPFMYWLLDEKIDEYADIVRNSVEMDTVRWKNVESYDGFEVGHYREFDNNVRYLKYFLGMRLNYLSQKWNILYRKYTPEKHEKLHRVDYLLNDEIVETVYIEDGENIKNMPYINQEEYRGWYIQGKAESYKKQLPIYEDIILYAVPW